MTLLSVASLCKALTPLVYAPGKATHFSGFSCHSGQTEPGFLFVMIPGTQTDGSRYLQEAVSRGITGVMGTEDAAREAHQRFPHLTCVGVPDVRLALTTMVSTLYAQRPNFLAAVTGTNGKTSIVTFAQALWGRLGLKAASLGTLGLFTGQTRVPLPVQASHTLTTPDPTFLYPCLDLLAQEGLQHVALEAASHGLDQKRLDGLRFDVGVFTNLTRDHLDYHPTMAAYYQAKSRLFKTLLKENSTAILHADLPHLADLMSLCRTRHIQIWTYGQQGHEMRIDHITPTALGQRVHATLWGEPLTFDLSLYGTFQAENALAALGIIVASGVSVADVVPLMPYLTTVPGRLEKVGQKINGASVYIDYAHTPDALCGALKALRPHTKGKLGVVFGCGGDRDPGKRPEMGAYAAQQADFVIVTDDNPRTEDPDLIRRSIREGCPNALEVPDRSDAIALGIEMLSPGASLLIAGKGHEQTQHTGGIFTPFDDKIVAHMHLKHAEG